VHAGIRSVASYQAVTQTEAFALGSLPSVLLFPLENVATLLGNTIRVAEKHYSPWVKTRQDALEAAVKGTWALDSFEK
jgi:hypothetical protein